MSYWSLHIYLSSAACYVLLFFVAHAVAAPLKTQIHNKVSVVMSDSGSPGLSSVVKSGGCGGAGRESPPLIERDAYRRLTTLTLEHTVKVISVYSFHRNSFSMEGRFLFIFYHRIIFFFMRQTLRREGDSVYNYGYLSS